MNLQELINAGKGTVVDVRSRGEFMGGNVAGSINIPLDEITDRFKEVKALEQPLVLVCASGGRSGMAEQFISKEGLECYNGGSWLNVNYLQAQKVSTL
jgi:rhodanese-related sulfurtransferase